MHSSTFYPTTYPIPSTYLDLTTTFLQSFHSQVLDRPLLISIINGIEDENVLFEFLFFINGLKIESRLEDKYYFMVLVIITKILEINDKKIQENTKNNLNYSALFGNLKSNYKNHILTFISEKLFSDRNFQMFVIMDLKTCSLSTLAVYEKINVKIEEDLVELLFSEGEKNEVKYRNRKVMYGLYKYLKGTY